MPCAVNKSPQWQRQMAAGITGATCAGGSFASVLSGQWDFNPLAPCQPAQAPQAQSCSLCSPGARSWKSPASVLMPADPINESWRTAEPCSVMVGIFFPFPRQMRHSSSNVKISFYRWCVREILELLLFFLIALRKQPWHCSALFLKQS